MEKESGECMENFTVEYYETEDGTRPAEEFILSQDKKMQAKLFMSLELLRLKGQVCGNRIQSLWATVSLRFVRSRELTSVEYCTSSS